MGGGAERSSCSSAELRTTTFIRTESAARQFQAFLTYALHGSGQLPSTAALTTEKKHALSYWLRGRVGPTGSGGGGGGGSNDSILIAYMIRIFGPL